MERDAPGRGVDAGELAAAVPGAVLAGVAAGRVGDVARVQAPVATWYSSGWNVL